MFIYYLYLKRFFCGEGKYSVFSGVFIWLGFRKNHPVPTPNPLFLHLTQSLICVKLNFSSVNLSDFCLIGTFLKE